MFCGESAPASPHLSTFAWNEVDIPEIISLRDEIECAWFSALRPRIPRNQAHLEHLGAVCMQHYGSLEESEEGVIVRPSQGPGWEQHEKPLLSEAPPLDGPLF